MKRNLPDQLGWVNFIWIAIFFFSCDNTGECTGAEPIAQLSVSFVKRDSSAKTGKKDSILSFRRIYALGSVADFYGTGTKRSKVSLNFNPTADQSTFIFDRSNDTLTIFDTIVMSYRRQYRLLSTKCPPRIEFNQIVHQSHTFDSLRVNSNSAEENVLEVYFAR